LGIDDGLTCTSGKYGLDSILVQIATDAAFTSIVNQARVSAAATSYQFSGGVHQNTYYGRISPRDRALNDSAPGGVSDGITVIDKGAGSSPGAPVISTVGGRAVLGDLTAPINFTSNVQVAGSCDSENLVEIYLDGSYVKSVISTAGGNYSYPFASLTPANHTVKTRCHNGFGYSPFSSEVTIIIDMTTPTAVGKLLVTGGLDRTGRNYVSTFAGINRLEYLDLTANDAGGAGIDLTAASFTVTDILDDGSSRAPTGTYTNPISGNMSITGPDTARFTPSSSWESCLQNGHRYRARYGVKDKASNAFQNYFDFVVDDIKPGQAAGVPVTTPAGCNFKAIGVYDLDTYPSGTPPSSAVVPLKWDAGNSDFRIDPAFSDAALVTSQ